MADIDLGKIGDFSSPPRTEKAPTQKNFRPTGKLTFYKLHSVPGAEKSRKITKFDSDLNVESSYFMNYMPSNNGGYFDCQCPASKFDCRHKAIMKTIEEAKQVDGTKFYCFETKTFVNAEDIK